MKIMKRNKLHTCRICGEKFELLKENRYTAIENNGAMTALNGTKYFDCFDCPHCGCQNYIGVRLGRKEK